jgi:hypothetical protein
VSLANDAPADQLPSGLAYALPYEGTHIVVFVERLKSRIEPRLVYRLLAYVLAHEITHNLQGINVHSETGIMKASWDHRDFFEMGRKGLGFTGLDISRIRDGLAARQSRLIPDVKMSLPAGQ